MRSADVLLVGGGGGERENQSEGEQKLSVNLQKLMTSASSLYLQNIFTKNKLVRNRKVYLDVKYLN
jgi:hypothetical protein